MNRQTKFIMLKFYWQK